MAKCHPLIWEKKASGSLEVFWEGYEYVWMDNERETSSLLKPKIEIEVFGGYTVKSWRIWIHVIKHVLSGQCQNFPANQILSFLSF